MVTDVLYLWVLLKIYKEVSMDLVICYWSLNFIILDSNQFDDVDIHFQYNVFLQAIFLFSIYLMME